MLMGSVLRMPAFECRRTDQLEDFVKALAQPAVS
jgi:3-deoxy-D-manno-octulosonic acid (KDO) 8-phosphate synthase